MAYQVLAAASFGANIASNYAQLQASTAQAEGLEYQASRYRFKAERSRIAADSARIQTNLNNTILQEKFNETQALQATQFAMQGRSGATIANIISQDQENLNWDKEFMKLSGTIQATDLELDALGYEQDASQSDIAAIKTRRAGRSAATLGLLTGGISASQLL